MTFSDTMIGFAETVASNAPDPQVFSNAATLASKAVGHDLLTVMRFHRATFEVERIYTNRPDVYPVGGRKPKKETPWGHHVLTEGKIFTGGASEIRKAFSDHAIIIGLGLRYVANVPIRLRGTTLGTINLLRGPNPFEENDLYAIQIVAGLIAGRLTTADR